jgi:hypothetical protein
MRKPLVILFMLSVPLVAQNAIYVFPPSPHIPTGGVQSLTAVVTGNTNKSVTWTKNGAACRGFIGYGDTIGVTTSGTGTCTITATMVADGTTSASSTVKVEAVRTDLQAAGIHPRLGLTPADVCGPAGEDRQRGQRRLHAVGLATILFRCTDLLVYTSASAGRVEVAVRLARLGRLIQVQVDGLRRQTTALRAT